MIFSTRPYAELRLTSDTFTNPRTRSGLGTDEIRELAIHIGRHGLKVPLRVTADGTITAGQRRYLAISLVLAWRDTLYDEVSVTEHALFDLRAVELAGAVPCVLDEEVEPTGLLLGALADNVSRAEMSSYEIAQQVIVLADRGVSNAAIADGIGKSRTYVSKMVTAWRGCCPELREAWSEGLIPYDRVKELAGQSPDDQISALVRMRAGIQQRGTHGRPGIDALKAMLARAAQRTETPGNGSDLYLRGIVDALRVATGDVAPEAAPVNFRAALEVPA